MRTTKAQWEDEKPTQEDRLPPKQRQQKLKRQPFLNTDTGSKIQKPDLGYFYPTHFKNLKEYFL